MKHLLVFYIRYNYTYDMLFWKHVTADWPSRGYLYKFQNKVQRSANNIFVIWDLIVVLYGNRNCFTVFYFENTKKCFI
jgi:hypothetical protein